MRQLFAGRAIVSLAALMLAGLLAGCQSSDTTGSIPAPEDYRLRHPIRIGQQLESMSIPVGPAVPRLADRMRGNITGFAQRYSLAGATRIAVVVPTETPNARVARSIGQQAASALIAAGVPRRAIEYRTYPAGAEGPEAPVLLAFSKIGAHVDGCGQWPESDASIEANLDNRSLYNFGCATQQNLAASVVDPLDLLYPRGMAAADATRRSDVFTKYEQGQPTASSAVQDTTTTTGSN